MPYDPETNYRRSIRLQGYDYSQAGIYFVTLCTYQRDCLLGGIMEGEVRLSQEGEIARTMWLGLGQHYVHVALDEYVIMPNHLHGLLVLIDAGEYGTADDNKRHGLPEIVRGFKSFSARAINQVRGMTGNPVWQRNYYEHIVRNDDDLNRIREYIVANPERWAEDQDNPAQWKS